MISLNFSNGWAPTRLRPSMKKFGVPFAPTCLASAMSAWMRALPAPLSSARLELADVEAELLRVLLEVRALDVLLVGEQLVVHLPELPLRLGRDRPPRRRAARPRGTAAGCDGRRRGPCCRTPSRSAPAWGPRGCRTGTGSRRTRRCSPSRPPAPWPRPRAGRGRGRRRHWRPRSPWPRPTASWPTRSPRRPCPSPGAFRFRIPPPSTTINRAKTVPLFMTNLRSRFTTRPREMTH